jgi:hypothetical protein
VYSLELEEGLLGSMLLSSEVCSKALEALTVDDFGDERTRCVFGVMAKLGTDVGTARVVVSAREAWSGDPTEIGLYVLKLPDWVSRPSAGNGILTDLLALRQRRALHDASALLAKAADATDPDSALHLARALVAPDPSANGWRRTSAAELLSQPFAEPRWLVPSLLPEGLCIFAARPKTGKSWMALQLAIAVATGGRFFGEEVEQGSVLYLALEDGDRRLARRLEALCCPRSVEGLHFQFGLPPLTNGGVEYLTRLVEETEPALVVVDTISRALEAKTDQDKNADMTAALGPLQQLAIRSGLCMMLIDHLRKPDGPMTEKNPITEVMGSTAKVGVADTIWGLYRKKGERRGELTTTGRDVEDAELVLDFTTMPGGWQLVGSAKDVGRSASQQRYLDALGELGPSDHRQVAEFLDVTPQSAGEVLRRLAESGRAVVVSEPRATGKPRLVYSLGPSRARARREGEASIPSNLPTDDDGWGGTWWNEH